MKWKNWVIQKIVKKGKYLYAVVPEHPKANEHGYVLEHRIVLENKLGRLLIDKEEAHHIDGDGHNNSPENIALMMNGEHQRFHSLKYPCGHTIKIICPNCGIEFEKDYRNRKENKGASLSFCSRRCNGLYYKHITNTFRCKNENHGINMYRYGCRCDICRKGNCDKQKKYRESKK